MLEVYFAEADDLEAWFWRGRDELPAALAVTHFGFGERRIRKPGNALSNKQALDNHIRKHGIPWWLYGDNCVVQLDHYNLREAPSRLSFWLSAKTWQSVGLAEALFRHFDGCRALYGYGCLFSEFWKRNILEFRIEGARRSATSPVGTDVCRYLPGLYWINYFSSEYQKQMKLDPERIAARLPEPTVLPTKHGVIVKLYSKPEDWPRCGDLVSDIIHDTPNVFSMRDVQAPPAMSIKETEAWSHRLHEQWP